MQCKQNVEHTGREGGGKKSVRLDLSIGTRSERQWVKAFASSGVPSEALNQRDDVLRIEV